MSLDGYKRTAALQERGRVPPRRRLAGPTLRGAGQGGVQRGCRRQRLRPHHRQAHPDRGARDRRRRGPQLAAGLQPGRQEPLLHDRSGLPVLLPGALRPGGRQGDRGAPHPPAVGRPGSRLLARRPLVQHQHQQRRQDRAARLPDGGDEAGQAAGSAGRHQRRQLLPRRLADGLLRRGRRPARALCQRPQERQGAADHPRPERGDRPQRPGPRAGDPLQVVRRHRDPRPALPAARRLGRRQRPRPGVGARRPTPAASRGSATAA